MKLRIVAISLFLVLLMTCFNSAVVQAPTTYEKFGPRVKDIIFRVAGSLGAEAEDLQYGRIDLMDWAVPADKLDPLAWPSDPNIVLEDYSEAGFYELDLNCMMWPLGHGPMNESGHARTKWGSSAPTADMDWTFPTSWDAGHYWIDYDTPCQRCLDAKNFRKAIAWLTNRDAVSSQFSPTIAPMQTFVFPVIAGWENPSAPKYSPYSVFQAKAMLDAGGFMDYDGDTKREYCKDVAARELWKSGGPVPSNWEEIPDIQLWRRTDDPPRSMAGELLRDGLAACSVEVDDHPGSYNYCTPHAWDDYDYHIYTGGWSWGTVPDMYHDLWHSSMDSYPATDGDSYNRYHRKEYDTLAYNFKYALNMTAAKTNCDACQMMLHDDVACIPLWTMGGSVAHRKYCGEAPYTGLEWQGFINEEGYGYYGSGVGFSLINAHPAGYERGATIRQGLINPPDKLDPVDSESFYEGLIIAKIYEPLIMRDPTNSTNYLPWLCSSFTAGTWTNSSGKTNSKVRVQLLPNVLWHDNQPLTPEDVKFTFEYKHAADTVFEKAGVYDFDHANYTGNTIDIYFRKPSFLAVTWVAGVTIIPKHIFEPYPPTLPGDPTTPGSWSFDPERADKLIGTGPFKCFKDGVVGRIDISAGRDYIHLTANPTYFRELVRPDFARYDTGSGLYVPEPSGKVDLDDFVMVILRFGQTKPWADPTWGPIADVNKDYLVDLDDIMETGARFGQMGYVNGYPSYYG